jgi:hypothetical protein
MQAVFGNLKWLDIKNPKTGLKGSNIAMKYAIACFSDYHSAEAALRDLESWVWDESCIEGGRPRKHHLKTRIWNAEKKEEWQQWASS